MDSRTALYRIFQEALTNIARHAQAKYVNVILRITKDNLEMEITDDGIGYDIDHSENEKSLGILGMRERVHILGGTFAIHGEEKEGTSVIVKIPNNQNSRKYK